jgi:hypothetical protein
MIVQSEGVMKLDPDVRSVMVDIPAEYVIEKSKNHYYLRVDGHPRIIIAGNHGRLNIWELRKTVKSLRQLIEKLKG